MTAAVSPPFPVAQAQTIRDWATQLVVPRAIELVDQIQDWLGHPANVTEATRKWSPVATGHIVRSANGLSTAAIDLADYWEGRGADAFVGYSGNLQSFVASTRIPVQQVAETLRDSLDIIKEAYVAGVRLIADFANKILDAAKSLPDIIGGALEIAGGVATRNPLTVASGTKTLIGGATSAVLTVLQAFVSAAEQLTTTYITILTDKTKAILRLESAESILPAPEVAPSSLGDPDRWKVRPADDYDSPVPDVEPPVPTDPPQGPGGDVEPPPATGTPAPDDGSPGPGGAQEQNPGGPNGSGGEVKPPGDGQGGQGSGGPNDSGLDTKPPGGATKVWSN
jgi:hypothetical protein